MLLSVSDNDFRVPQGNTLTMYSALQRMNVPARLLVWPDENHWITKGENSRVFYREVRSWLEHLNLNDELAKALSKMVIEVKTEIRFRPAEDGRMVPETTNEVKVKPPSR